MTPHPWWDILSMVCFSVDAKKTISFFFKDKMSDIVDAKKSWNYDCFPLCNEYSPFKPIKITYTSDHNKRKPPRIFLIPRRCICATRWPRILINQGIIISGTISINVCPKAAKKKKKSVIRPHNHCTYRIQYASNSWVVQHTRSPSGCQAQGVRMIWKYNKCKQEINMQWW